MSKTIIKILVQHPSVDYLAVSVPRMVTHQNTAFRLLLHRKLSVRNAGPHLNTLQHLLYHSGIPAHWNALITIIKIIIVICKPQRKTFNDKRRQFLAIPAPLLLGISLDQLLIDVRSHLGERLLLQIMRFRDLQRSDLLCDLRFSLGRCHHTPHLAKGVHIKREIIQLSLIIRDR